MICTGALLQQSLIEDDGKTLTITFRYAILDVLELSNFG